uniref:SGNH hydrolase-type esterase domain-containing protein n=1 Tax=Oreochromis niloticus TaxID=8128 RepID=A0A669DSZ3_ORENI
MSPGRGRTYHRQSTNTKVLCFPKDMVNNLKERILQIADEYPTVTNIVLHTGSNDVSKQQSEVLKRDFTGLLNTVNSLNAAVFISGPVPPVRGGDERFSRLFALNKWLISACTDHSVHFINNFNIFWERRHLFKIYPPAQSLFVPHKPPHQSSPRFAIEPRPQ